MNTKVHIAKQLIAIKAVSIAGKDRLFTWASGIKSPIYCDNRITMSYPKVRRQIAEAFAQKIKRDYSEAEVIAGTATAGIPHAAWIANILDLPMIYVRSTMKGHGKENQIEGRFDKGQKVVLIEDLISTGGSSLTAVDALVKSGAKVLSVGAIFTYNFLSAEQAFKSANISCFTLTDYLTLLPIAREEGYILEDDLHSLKAWRENPRMFTE